VKYGFAAARAAPGPMASIRRKEGVVKIGSGQVVIAVSPRGLYRLHYSQQGCNLPRLSARDAVDDVFRRSAMEAVDDLLSYSLTEIGERFFGNKRCVGGYDDPLVTEERKR
jgi:hypothetical protein